MDQQILTSRDIIGTFYETVQTAAGAGWVPNVSMLFPSNQQFENYKWLGFSPALSRWVGTRRPTSLKGNGVTIENLLFDATLEISVDDLRRDKSQQILIRVQELAAECANHWATLLTALIEGGETTVCYDGNNFFDTVHQEGSSPVQKNTLVKTDYSELQVVVPTNPTANELANIIMKLIQHLYSIKKDNGQPMNEFAKEFLVLVPVNMYGNAVKAVNGMILTTGVGAIDNPLKYLPGFNIRVEVNPRSGWSNKLAVFRTDGRARPFIRQAEDLNSGSAGASAATNGSSGFDETIGIKVNAIAEGSEEAIKHRRHLYTVEASRNVGYGYWQQAVLATLST
jgi:phage major head subunit gpT-like protein